MEEKQIKKMKRIISDHVRGQRVLLAELDDIIDKLVAAKQACDGLIGKFTQIRAEVFARLIKECAVESLPEVMPKIDLYWFQEGNKELPPGVPTLPLAVINFLKKEKKFTGQICFLSDFYRYTWHDIEQMPGIGKKSLDRIRIFLKELQIDLPNQ